MSEQSRPSRQVSTDMYEALHPSFFPYDSKMPRNASQTNQFEIIPTAHLFVEELVERIQEAEETVDLQFYTLEADNVTKKVVEASLDAASRGVEVRFLVDHLVSDPRRLWSTLKMNREIEQLACANLKRVRVAEGLANIATRDHKKLVAIDAQSPEGYTYIGGVNLAARSFRWNDFMVRMRGSISELVQQDFEDSWNGENRAAKFLPDQEADTYLLTDSGHEEQIMDFSLSAIRQARDMIWLETPYLDMKHMGSALAEAKNNNPELDVRVILPRYNNYPVDRMKSLTNRRQLEAAGIDVCFYGKTYRRLNHTKMLIIDDMGIFGSSNFNSSGIAGGNAEIAVATRNESMVEQLKRWYTEDLQEAA